MGEYEMTKLLNKAVLVAGLAAIMVTTGVGHADAVWQKRSFYDAAHIGQRFYYDMATELTRRDGNRLFYQYADGSICIVVVNPRNDKVLDIRYVTGYDVWSL